jgi:hypothetical protein
MFSLNIYYHWSRDIPKCIKLSPFEINVILINVPLAIARVAIEFACEQ